MGKYENGVSTRKMILDAAGQLFLEKGFHETGNEDICRAAHVNRSAIHYHFSDKENLRYEVLWELFKKYRETVSQYCCDSRFQVTSAIYLSWCYAVEDERIRRFYADYSRDYPVYVRGQNLSEYYRMLYQYTLGEIWSLDQITSLNFSAIYGHLMGQMRLAASQPDQYSGKELFLHGMKACLQTWDIPEEKGRAFWKEMVENIEKIPEEIIKKPLEF